MKPDKLYHFTTTEKAIQYILPTCKLRMNTLEKMNDPKENLNHIINSHLYSDKQFERGEINETIDAILISQETKTISFSTDKQTEQETIKGYNLQRMWAQYGGNHTGICIVIDYTKFITENSKIIKNYGIKDDNVEYNNNFCVPPSFSPLIGKKAGSNKSDSLSRRDVWKKYQSDSHFIKQRFFTKNNDWEGESEYRFLTFIESDTEEIYLSFRNSLDKVITGLNFSRFYLPSLESLVEKNKIDKLIFDEWHGNFELESDR